MSDFLDAAFVKSVVRPADAPRPRLGEICIIGRSNVGKSSLINALTGRKNLARVSGKPGRTKTINYYLIGGKFYLVDAPGYGYTGGSTHYVRAFAAMMEPYFNNEHLKLAIILIDARRGPGGDDLMLRELLKELNIPALVVLTKYDKLNQREKSALRRKIAASFPDDEPIIGPLGDEKALNKLRARLDEAWQKG